MPSTYRVAAAQIDVKIGDVDANLARIEEIVRETARKETLLTVFPECALTGYCFETLDEAKRYAQLVPGPASEKLAGICRELNAHVVTGMIEKVGDQVFNAAVLVGPGGLIGGYRKIHLPYLGLDRFATPGDRPFQVWDTGPLRIGMHICYDGSFPESARVMTLLGADLIVLPTNWPPKSECAAAHLANVRAHENIVYFMSVNRVGTERGFGFIGGSKICDPAGETMAESPHTEEEILYADIEPERARQKRLIRIPGKHEIDRIADRRPEMYGPLTQPIKR